MDLKEEDLFLLNWTRRQSLRDPGNPILLTLDIDENRLGTGRPTQVLGLHFLQSGRTSM